MIFGVGGAVVAALVGSVFEVGDQDRGGRRGAVVDEVEALALTLELALADGLAGGEVAVDDGAVATVCALVTMVPSPELV